MFPGSCRQYWMWRYGHPVFHIERVTYTFENPVTSVEYIILGEVAFEDTFEPHEALYGKITPT